MTNEPIYISGKELIAALELITKLMKEDVRKMPETSYHAAGGGLSPEVSLAVVFTFERDTLRHKATKICSEKRAAKEWVKANGIKI